MRLLPIILLFLIFSCKALKSQSNELAYPSIKPEPVSEMYDNKNKVDMFRNLENINDSTIINWQKEESQFAFDYINKLPEKQEWISTIEDIESRYISTPSAIRTSEKGELFYRYYNVEDETYSLVYQKDYKAEPIHLFNTKDYSEANDGDYYIDYHKPSWDGLYVAFSLTEGNGLESKLFVLDVENKKVISDEIDNTSPDKFGGINWLPDSSGFLVTKFPVINAEEEGYKSNSYLSLFDVLSKKEIGPIFDAKTVNVKNSSLFALADISSSQNKYVISYLATSDDFWEAYYTETALLKTNKPVWKKIYSAEDKVYADSPFLFNEKLYFKSGATNNYNISFINIDNPVFEPTVFIKDKGNETIGDFRITSRGMFYSTMTNGVEQHLYLNNFQDVDKEIELPFAVGDLTLRSVSPDKNEFWVLLAGWTTELVRYKYNTKGIFEKQNFNETSLYKEFDDIIAIETEYKSHDGTLVPISIIKKRNLSMDSNNPTIIYAYGAFKESMSPVFLPTYLSWVAKGGILVFPHIRGGGEKGVEWYENGRKDTKFNSWMDLVSAGEYLIKENYTSKDHMVLYTASGGAIAGGMAINVRPDLFKMSIAEVPLLNPARTGFGRFDNSYHLEFGDINNENEIEGLFAMDPYMNIKVQDYPTTLVLAAGNDDVLEIWQSTKYIAKMQALSTSSNPHLLYIDPDAGHGAISDYYNVYGMIFGLAEHETGNFSNVQE